MARFCQINSVVPPLLRSQSRDDFRFANKTCAYYRPQRISICLPVCASPGHAGMAWSWPGYAVDRTPHGVVQHELGHHVDWLQSPETRGPYWSGFSSKMRMRSGEEKLTNYCPNDAEWFAEMFRLFVTNPDLLSKIRPRIHEEMTRFWVPASQESWDVVLAGAPERTLDACEKRIKKSAHNHKTTDLFS
jgi:hypothetical protein